MAQVDQIQIGTTTYDILQSSDATFTGTSNDSSSATSWTNVDVLSSSETNASIFTKISSMFKNIRYLYSLLGDIDVSSLGGSISEAIKNINENKADKDHTHSTSDLKAQDGTNLISTIQVADNNHVPSSLLVKNMNDTLTALSNAADSYVTKLGVSGTTITYYHRNTSLGTITTQDTNTTYSTATSAAAGLLRKLEPSSTTKFLRADGTWQVNSSGSTYAVVTTAIAGLCPKLGGGTTNYLRADGNWATPPNTNTTYGTNVGCYGSLNGTTLTLNTRNFRV